MTYCVQQLLRWRPLRQCYSLRSEVRELIHDLGCGRRRGCRAGKWSRVRPCVNKQQSADSIPTLVSSCSSRLQISRLQRRYDGRRECRAAVRQLVELQAEIPVRVTVNSRQRDAATASGMRRSPSTLIAVPSRQRPPTLNIGLLNAHSISNKVVDISDCIMERHLDIFAVVESWHDSTVSPSLIAATPPSYRYVEKARPRKKVNSSKTNHGGICVFLRTEFKVRTILLPVYKSFEALMLSVRHGAVNVTVLTIYRPPPSATDEFFY